MKARILTFSRAYNYGAVLQCYALAKSLTNQGICCDVLDYYPNEFKYIYCNKSRPVPLRELPGKILVMAVRNIIPSKKKRERRFSAVLEVRNKKFEDFLSKHIPLSEETICSEKEMVSVCSDVDCYIAGSDQIWNSYLCNFDSTFFLDFPDAQNKKRYSYAASFGMTQLPEKLTAEYKRRLNLFDMISVREESGASIVKELTGKDATVSCDPALLLTGEEWAPLCSPNREKEPYILVYYTWGSKELQERAKMLSEKTGYKVVSLPCTMNKDVITGTYDAPYGFDVQAQSGPAEFLSLFKNAEYVLTNTFHGTVFSILFHKPFLTALTTPKGQKNTRITELLDALDLKNRSYLQELDDIDIPIAWVRVEEKLLQLRNSAMAYIDKMIRDCERGQ